MIPSKGYGLRLSIREHDALADALGAWRTLLWVRHGLDYSAIVHLQYRHGCSNMGTPHHIYAVMALRSRPITYWSFPAKLVWADLQWAWFLEVSS